MVELATDRGRCGPAVSVKTDVSSQGRKRRDGCSSRVPRTCKFLKRLLRFLKGSPRCLIVYNRQVERPIVDVFSNSDWAACAKTRRSTSSSYVMLGGHLIAPSATTQNVVATSSGEAEFYALTKSASRALGAVAMAADVSQVVKPRGRRSVEGDCLKARSGAS